MSSTAVWHERVARSFLSVTESVLQLPLFRCPISEAQIPLNVKLRLIVEVLTACALTRWRLSHEDVRDIVSEARASLREATVPETSAARLGGVVSRTLRVLPGDSRCLLESLVLTQMLSRRGIASTLVIGARSRPRFVAHAWVEHNAGPVLPTAGFASFRLIEF